MTDPWDERSLIDDVLARGVDDWVDFGLVVDVARRCGVSSEEALTSLALGLVAIVVIEGLMTPGIVRDGSFEAWDLKPGEAEARIVSEWRRIGTPNLRPADIAWLCNTESGDIRGKAVLDDEAASS